MFGKNEIVISLRRLIVIFNTVMTYPGEIVWYNGYQVSMQSILFILSYNVECLLTIFFAKFLQFHVCHNVRIFTRSMKIVF